MKLIKHSMVWNVVSSNILRIYCLFRHIMISHNDARLIVQILYKIKATDIEDSQFDTRRPVNSTECWTWCDLTNILYATNVVG